MKIYTLPLSDSGEPLPAGNGQFIKLPNITEESYILRFIILSASDIVNHGILHCNVPPQGVEFSRSKFYDYPIKASFNSDTHIDIEITSSGSFSFFFTYVPVKDPYFKPRTVKKTISQPQFSNQTFLTVPSTKKGSANSPYDASDSESIAPSEYTEMAESDLIERTCSKKFYFIVSAGLSLDGKPLSLNSLNIETVVSKWMGPYNSWDEKFTYIKSKGYNMIHFTPLNARGDSNSPYSIYDQLSFDKDFFPNGEHDISKMVSEMEHKHQLLALTDVVYNHTANNSEWLKEHPDAGYSVKTAPHLEPALEIDTSLLKFSDDLKKLGLPTNLNNLGDLGAVMNGVQDVLSNLKLWEYYAINVKQVTERIKDTWNNTDISEIEPIPCEGHDLKSQAHFVASHAGVNLNTFGCRYVRTVDSYKFVQIISTIIPKEDHDHLDKVHEVTTNIINEINLPFYQEYDQDIQAILTQLYNRIKYTRLDSHGPKLGEITKKSPLIETYFTRIQTSGGEEVALVNNGWIWNGNPLVDFASSKSKAYLRREVIIWGDCVKLRYGSHPNDSPYLWDRMTKYTQLMAKYFHGFRIDNAHSTPLHVGEYMLDKARLIRPDLYVVAELFTGSEKMDKIFVERLGLTSLIREAMQAWSPEELSRLVHRHGGRPIGSFSQQPIVTFDKYGETDPKTIVQSSNIHALFMDCTHDNEMPAQKRTVEDTLPNAALVAMCSCSVGSVMGYDEGYPHLLEIVSEKRTYTIGGGISKIKKVLLDAHVDMGQKNASEMHVHHEGQYITVHRVNPQTGEGWFLIARTEFHRDGDQKLNDVVLQGTKAENVVCAHLKQTGDYKSSHDKLNSIPTELVDLPPPTIGFSENVTTIKLNEFPQGSIALMRTSIVNIDGDLESFIREDADEMAANLDLLDLNVVLYRCDAEERDYTGGDGVYYIPNHGNLVYAGLVGWLGPLQEMINDNNLAHAISEHLRQGQWALDYTVNRLYKYNEGFPSINPYIEWLKSRFDRIRHLPSFFLPRYFALVIVNAYLAFKKRALGLMKLEHKTLFLQRLSLTSIQMVGIVKSTSLFPFEDVGSMAAGLPHFSHDYMRCWGRDVFLSLQGLLIHTGRHKEAKQHILGFAKTLKHGLIPNLLDAGRNPRYNARDATWFFTQSVQEYVNRVPDGHKILDEVVKRRFPLNDDYVPVDDSRAFSEETSIRDILYEILSRHAQSIKFREANAGPSIDSQMKDEGFNQYIYVDWANGMIFGGNKWNCGTWMDKMGESTKAGNQGYPGTPRDGAAVEIIGLLKSTLRFVLELNKKGLFKYTDVVNQHGDKVTFKHWNNLLQKNFEKCFYIPMEGEEGNYDVDNHIIHRRGIYKDLYKSSSAYEDYQLRPNFAIAMVVAPELFEVGHAMNAISLADRVIRGPVGMATLDPEDMNYRPYYHNSEDSIDFTTSKGRNYHQGPEWLWCTGFFLRAFLKFDLVSEKEHEEVGFVETFQQVARRMVGHRQWIRTSHWAGLTELTNKDGELCADSSPTQAWSSATLIELFADANELWEERYGNE